MCVLKRDQSAIGASRNRHCAIRRHDGGLSPAAQDSLCDRMTAGSNRQEADAAATVVLFLRVTAVEGVRKLCDGALATAAVAGTVGLFLHIETAFGVTEHQDRRRVLSLAAALVTRRRRQDGAVRNVVARLHGRGKNEALIATQSNARPDHQLSAVAAATAGTRDGAAARRRHKRHIRGQDEAHLLRPDRAAVRVGQSNVI